MQNEFSRIAEILCRPAEEPAPPEQEAVVPAADRQRAIDLASAVMQGRWRVMLSSLSREECKRLEVLQEKFDALEREFTVRFPNGTLEEVLAGFDLSKLRSFIPPPEPARKVDWNWGFQVVHQQAPTPPRPQAKRLYGCGTTGNND